MKKLLSAITSAALICAGAVPFAASAETSNTPGFYFKGTESSLAETAEEGEVIYIDRTKLSAEGDNLVNVRVYVREESGTAWYVSPKWKSSSPLLKICNLVDPKDPDLVTFAYSEINKNSEIIKGKYSTLASTDEKWNTMGFTCMYQTYTETSPLVPYGDESDSYPLTWFDIQIDPSIPNGDYDIHFLETAEDYDDQRTCEINVITDNGTAVADLENRNLSVCVYTPYDVDNTGSVTSTDASAVLAAYAKLSCNQPTGLKKYQLRAGDYDGNGELSSTDASAILKYYAMLSTDNAE